MINEQRESIVQPKRTVRTVDVDKVADFLVLTYKDSDGFNPLVRGWYCKLAYRFGVQQLYDWEKGSRDASNPAKVFSILARDALNKSSPREVRRG
jgi:hypothetical protein